MSKNNPAQFIGSTLKYFDSKQQVHINMSQSVIIWNFKILRLFAYDNFWSNIKKSLGSSLEKDKNPCTFS